MILAELPVLTLLYSHISTLTLSKPPLNPKSLATFSHAMGVSGVERMQ